MPNIPQINIGGTVYKVKDAELRDEVDDLKSAINEEIESRNIAFELITEKGKSVQNDGTIISNAVVDLTGYIEIPQNADYITVLNKITIGGTAYRLNPCFAVYDKNKNFIKGVNSFNIGITKFFIEKSWSYVRVNISNETADIADITVKFGKFQKDRHTNILDYANVTKGKYIASDKTEKTNIWLALTDLIYVDGVYSFEWYDDFDGHAYDCKGAFYDQDGNIIDVVPKHSTSVGGKRTIIIPSDCVKYIRVNLGINKPEFLYFNYKEDIIEIAGDAAVTPLSLRSENVNLFPFVQMDNVTPDSFIDTDGQIKEHGTLFVTDYIDVTDVVSVTLNNSYDGTHALTCKGAFFNKDRELISVITSSVVGNVTFSVPSTAKYLRFNGAKSIARTIHEVMYFVKSFPEWIANSAISKWAGKKAVFLGDSITEGTCITGVTNPLPAQMQTKLALSESINYGIGGTMLAGTSENSFVNRYSSMDNDADLVVVMGGTNDCLYGSLPLGELGDSTNTSFYGGLDVLMKGLQAKYPSASIVFMTPMHYYDGGSDHGEHNTDLQMDAWAKAVEEVAKRNGIPVIDFRNVINLNPNSSGIRNMYFEDHWIHPNQAGYNLISERLYKWFDLY